MKNHVGGKMRVDATLQRHVHAANIYSSNVLYLYLAPYFHLEHRPARNILFIEQHVVLAVSANALFGRFAEDPRAPSFR